MLQRACLPSCLWFRLSGVALSCKTIDVEIQYVTGDVTKPKLRNKDESGVIVVRKLHGFPLPTAAYCCPRLAKQVVLASVLGTACDPLPLHSRSLQTLHPSPRSMQLVIFGLDVRWQLRRMGCSWAFQGCISAEWQAWSCLQQSETESWPASWGCSYHPMPKEWAVLPTAWSI